jgi:methionyl aminopeptidase
MIYIKSPQEIEIMRKANAIVAEVLKRLTQLAGPGTTTLELDRVSEEICRTRGAKPAFKGYRGYPFSLCASVNEQVVHGFPNKNALKEGDILSMDFGVLYEGFYGDSAVTVPIGSVAENAERLMDATRESLYEGIQMAVEGNRLSDISHAVQVCVEQQGFSVVRNFVGHGIGRELHEDPQVPNFGTPGKGVRLREGMVLAIEPMVNEGTYEVDILDDGWTAVTRDRKLSAHFEHSIAVTKNGPDILSGSA